MSAVELRRKAQERQTKFRFEAVYSVFIGLILFGFFARTFARVHEVVPRMGMGLLTLWSIYVAYQAYKWIQQGRLAPDATLNTTLQSYRTELENRRDYGRHVWRKAGLTYCSLGLAMVVVPALIKSLDDPRLLVNMVPVFVLLAVWLAVFLPLRKRRKRKLQQEIDELRVFETED